MNSQYARAARVLAAITFHFVRARIGYHAEVARSLFEFNVVVLNASIVTNMFREEDLAALRRLCAEMLSDKNGMIRCFGNEGA
jgi:hypothetical protein